MSPRPPPVQRRLGGQLLRHLARLHLAHHWVVVDPLAVVGDPVDQLVAEPAELVGVHPALPCRPREEPTRAQRRRATRTSELRNQSVTGKLARTIHSSPSSRAPSPERTAPAEQRRVQAPQGLPEAGDEARRRRAARGEARQGEQPPGPQHPARLGDERGAVRRAEQIEHVGADDAVARSRRGRGSRTQPSVSSTRARPAHGATAALARRIMCGLTSSPR